MLAADGKLITATTGEATMALNQCGRHIKGEKTHLSGQIDSCNSAFDDKPIKFGSYQHATILDKCKLHASMKVDYCAFLSNHIPTKNWKNFLMLS